MHDIPFRGSSSAEPPSGVAEHTLLTAEEVAAILRVPGSWVYSHLNMLPVVRLGRYVRFRRKVIDRLADESDKPDGAGSCA